MTLRPAAPIDDFGTLPDGRPVRRVTLDNGALRVGLLDLGALIQDVRLNGIETALTLGSPDIAAYAGRMGHFGAVMGPVVNRIGGARAVIDGREYRFDANQDGRHTRHGGSAATHLKVWRIADHGPAHATFRIDLPDGEGGFPGNRRLTASYRLDDAALIVDLTATTDAPTPVNLANHGYWTMNGGPDWTGQRLQVLADRYLPTTDENLPTGAIVPVAGTPFDFREARELDPTLPKLDANFCLADAPRDLTPALLLAGPLGTLEIATTAPGMQVFDMGTIDLGDVPTHHARPYRPRFALAFEPQMWPDALGRADWPDIVLRPGRTFRQTTRYAFAA
ncbi:Aldose 1-epimerase [Oceaniovalibus guishaninsula JLT2003]|uniref:Aldose 1-epimerase n=1 Tax=Oceaniovalibus guishaninsula JLT2003 TaxID=1231392 RepID=K2H8Q7_9RHOB|nr:aldose epimerase family protein [Oceaniovalibus guishaninsula]EKE43963.1 Aldose 1-epimerase [Oceaniovalibus guishaninsula JLT2003]